MLLLLHTSTALQTSTSLQDVVVPPTVGVALPRVPAVVVVAGALPNTAVVVSPSSAQCSSTVHTVLRQLDDELNWSDMLELVDVVRTEEELLKVEEEDKLDDSSNSEDNREDEDEEDDIVVLDEELLVLTEEMLPKLEEELMLEETLLELQMSTLVQTLTFLQPVVVVPTVVRALPNVVVVVVVPLPNVLVSSLQSSFMMHTSWKQLEEELDVLENIEALELKSGELEEDEVMEELVEGLELSTEDDA